LIFHLSDPYVTLPIATKLIQSNMAPYDNTTGETRFDSFHIYRIPFKKVGDHEIEVGILVPKDLKPGKHPLIVKYHGGGLVSFAILTRKHPLTI
jgi:cephalosporin-C deacetylase-like acetyl esterase